MIEIAIKTNGEKIVDSFKKENTNLKEVGSVLLRLKQIEHELIKLEFDDDVNISEGY